MPAVFSPSAGLRIEPPHDARDALVGRQPIYDRNSRVVGYELLYRGAEAPADGGSATAQVMLNAFLEIGLMEVTGGKVAFVNMTRDCLLSDAPLALPPGRVVLEVLEDIPVDSELREAMAGLTAAGYRLALDDFVLDDPRWSLIEIAPLIKVELPAIPDDRLAGLTAELIDCGATLLAEKVETRQQRQRCLDLGFQYFQGFFLSRPSLVQGRRLPANRLSILNLIAKLSDPDIGLSELERLTSQDATLTFKLLQFCNSALAASRKRIDSVRTAIRQVGIARVSAWASVLLMARLDDKPGDLLTTALIRAHFCETLVAAVRPADTHGALLAGMLSMIEAIIERPAAEVIGQMRVTHEVAEAVLAREGLLGEALTAAISHERGEWEGAAFQGLPAAAITDAYLSAVRKAREYEALVAGSAPNV